MGFGNLGSSESRTKSVDDSSQNIAHEQGTVIRLQGGGAKTVGSTVIKVGKGGSFNLTNQGGSDALQKVADALGSAVRGQANFSGGYSPLTGLTTPEAPKSPIDPGLLTGGLVVAALGTVLFFVLKRR